ncbi:hypothetical protein C8R47DRAFT_1064510 [Mycena vitilis]|nr:hypothetical protein C8R47DRAFT_1064510 [Mycena vitilis]
MAAEPSTPAQATNRDDTPVVHAVRSEEEILTSMTDLLSLYGASPNDSMSTEDAVHMLVLKAHLASDDIWDWGVPALGSRPRFKVGPLLEGEVARAVTELQTILDRAASLVEGRSRGFQIDPRESCQAILRGANAVAQLEGAWRILVKRLSIGEQALLKYAAEVRKGEIPTSPASTATELHNALELVNSPDSRVRLMQTSFPHHNVRLDEAALKGLTEGKPWKELLAIDSPVLRAFPDRLPEVAPQVVYYAQDGTRSSFTPLPGEEWNDSNVTKRPERRQNNSLGGAQASVHFTVPSVVSDSGQMTEESSESRAFVADADGDGAGNLSTA